MSNLAKRTISGIVYVVVFLGCILYGPSSFCILFAIVTALTLNEFNELMTSHKLAEISNTISTISGVYLFLAFFCVVGRATGPVIFLPYILSLLFILISELYLKRVNPIANWAFTFGGQLYIALPFAMLNLLAFSGDAGYNALLPLAVFVFLWLNDSGAYVFGSLLHKKIPHKLFERISPNKSWIGSIGGCLVVLLSSIAFYAYDDSQSLLWWMGLGLVVVVFGTYGDLVESLLKRTLGIKDSGRFLPGHGGVLDRFDSALIAIPASVIYVYSAPFIF
jgi:phosphatidate cytidylyltransferase